MTDKIKLARTHNASRNIIVGILCKLLGLIIPFVSRTIIIRVMGADYLGLSSLFTSILQVLNMTELGFGSAIVFSMYEPISRDDTEELSALLNLYKKLYHIVGAVIFVAGLMVLPFLKNLIHGNAPENANIYVLYLLYLTNTSISYFLFGYRNALFNAYQRADILNVVDTLILIFRSILEIVVIVFAHNYYLFVCVHIISTVISNLLIAVRSTQMYPLIRCKGQVTQAKKRMIAQKVKGLMINKLCMVSRNAFDSIFISAFIGLVDTAIYNNYFYILTAVTGIMSLVGTAIKGGVGNSIVTETKEKNHEDMQVFNFLYMWIAGWFTVCLLCLYQPFTELVYGKDMLFPTSIVILFCIYFYILKMGDIRAVYSDAIGLWWENRYRAIFEALLNIALNYILGKYFGVIGIITATIISLFLINFVWGSTIIYENYFKRIPMKTYYINHTFFAIVATIISGICYTICTSIQISGIGGLLIRIVICAILPNICFFAVYRPTKLYKKAVGWIFNHYKFLARLGRYRIFR